MTLDRAEIMARLESRPWFKASRPSIKEALRTLGEDCNGYLADLARRPDVIGGVRQIVIEEIQIGDTSPTFGIWTIFLVQKVDNPSMCYRYQYFSWKHGPASGSKGVLLVRSKGIITHLVVMKGESFALGGDFYDCPGGFMEVGDQKTKELAAGLVERMRKEVLEEVGLDLSSDQLRLYELGRVMADPGMTNNRPALFAIEIDGSIADQIQQGVHVNPDMFELKAGPVLVPVERLWEEGGLVYTNDYAFFHVIVNRLVARGILRPPTL